MHAAGRTRTCRWVQGGVGAGADAGGAEWG